MIQSMFDMIDMSEAGRRVNVTRPLTRSLDLGEEGLAMQATRTCSIDGCTELQVARGLCLRHYDQARNAGTLHQHAATRTRVTTCTVDGCESPSSGQLCGMHRSRVRRTGTTEPRCAPTPEQDAERFWAKADRRGPDECWPWGGTMLDTGYGQFAAQGRKHMAHRYAYELSVGPIPDGLTIDHVWARGCIRTDCVNPAHLEPVTSAENLRRSNAASALNARKDSCRLGHPYRTALDGKRFCPTCKAEWERNRRRE